MAAPRVRRELGVELAAEEPRVLRQLDHFAKVARDFALRPCADDQARSFEPRQIMVVDFIAMTVPLGHPRRSVDAVRERARDNLARLRPEPHRSTQVGARRALFDRAIAILPFGNERDHRMRGRRVEFGAVSVGESRLVPRILDHRELHAKTDAKIRHAVLARVANRRDLAFDAALAESARHENRVDASEAIHTFALHGFGVDVLDLHPAAGVDAGVRQRFRQRLVRLCQVDVLANHCDPDRALGVLEAIDQPSPRR